MASYGNYEKIKAAGACMFKGSVVARYRQRNKMHPHDILPLTSCGISSFIVCLLYSKCPLKLAVIRFWVSLYAFALQSQLNDKSGGMQEFKQDEPVLAIASVGRKDVEDIPGSLFC